MALASAGPFSSAQFQTLEPIATQHAVRALLRDRVLARRDRDSGGDERYCAALTDIALREAALEARRNEHLISVLEALVAAGVAALLFKGAALAHSHYPRPELRERDDTDLAVNVAHLQAAGDVLERLGFRPITANEGSLVMRQRLYRRRDVDGLMHNIDLHWAISNSSRTARLTVRGLLARSVALPALSAHARVPGSIDALLIACAHLDAHHVDDVRLIWLYDIHLLIENMPIAMRVSATQRALEYGLAPACAWVLTALARALGSSLVGFEPLTRHDKITPPSGRRIAQWQRELLALHDNRTRMNWLWQQMIPNERYMRAPTNATTSLWRLHLTRLFRGITHLTR